MENVIPRTVLVTGDKTFKITVPDDAKLTFAPFSPPPRDGRGWDESGKRGTLRIYQGTEKNILACFSGVTGFRDLSLGYAEEIAKEEGATIWKDDATGYVRESKISKTNEWVEQPELTPARPTRRKANNA